MKRALRLAIPVVSLLAIAWPAPLTAADDTRVARGTVTAVSGSTLTLHVKGQDITFKVDEKTRVIARGAGTKANEAKAKGMPGPTLTDVVKPGLTVDVSYRDMNGALLASTITAIPSAGGSSVSPGATKTSGEAMKTSTDAKKVARGRVKSIGDGTFTVADGKRLWTFAIDPDTKVIAKDAGTRAASLGGRAQLAQLLHVRDIVRVDYETHDQAMRATQVSVTAPRGR